MQQKKLLDVTNAFLAIEDLRNSSIISADTRRAVERVYQALVEESLALMEDELASEGESQAAA